MAPRKFGIEEELLLVDPESGRATAVAHRALRAHAEAASFADAREAAEAGEHDVEPELFLQQIETATQVCETVGELEADVRRCRRALGEAARGAGAAAVAVAVPPLVEQGAVVTPKARYRRIVDEFGETSRQGVVCGMHVHVDVSSDDEAVGVIDRLRPWLPVLLAISANSPFWRGRDTGYASWRSQTWGRWPTAGPSEPFGDAAGYRAATHRLIETGAALDLGMLYFDVRLAESYPTVELRIADVCTEVDDAMLVAALARALVETVADDWAAGKRVPAWRVDALRAAQWRAARYGLARELVHPVAGDLCSARTAVEALTSYTRNALSVSGDAELVDQHFERLLSRGAGAARQRAVAEANGSLEAVVADLVRRTEVSWQD